VIDDFQNLLILLMANSTWEKSTAANGLWKSSTFLAASLKGDLGSKRAKYKPNSRIVGAPNPAGNA